MDDQRNGVQFQQKQTPFFGYHIQTNCGAHPASYPTGNVRSFPEQKLAGA